MFQVNFTGTLCLAAAFLKRGNPSRVSWSVRAAKRTPLTHKIRRKGFGCLVAIAEN